MGGHQRLGASSYLQCLDEHLLRLIVSLIVTIPLAVPEGQPFRLTSSRTQQQPSALIACIIAPLDLAFEFPCLRDDMHGSSHVLAGCAQTTRRWRRPSRRRAPARPCASAAATTRSSRAFPIRPASTRRDPSPSPSSPSYAAIPAQTTHGPPGPVVPLLPSPLLCFLPPIRPNPIVRTRARDARKHRSPTVESPRAAAAALRGQGSKPQAVRALSPCL
jgi:hypothetical protein